MSLLSTLGIWVAVISAAWPFFEASEKVSSPAMKQQATEWLQTINSTGLSAIWPNTVTTLLGRTMGERYLSWRSFGRSCIASLLAVISLAFVWGIIRSEEISKVIDFSFQNFGSKGFALIFFLLIPLVAVFLNFIPDYLALLKTRYVLRWMIRAPSLFRKTIFFVVDTVLSLGIGSIAMPVFIYTLMCLSVIANTGFLSVFSADVHSAIYAVISREYSGVILNSLALKTLKPQVNGGISLGVFLYSTLITSLWIWLYVIGGTLYRIIDWSRAGIHWVNWMFDVKKQPIRSIGFMGMTAFSIVYWLGAFIFWIVALLTS